MRLLVVDDERRLASALKHGLTREGYVVDIAHDGGVALTRLSTAGTTRSSSI